MLRRRTSMIRLALTVAPGPAFAERLKIGKGQVTLQSNPDVKVICAAADDMALGAMQVLAGNGGTA